MKNEKKKLPTYFFSSGSSYNCTIFLNFNKIRIHFQSTSGLNAIGIDLGGHKTALLFLPQPSVFFILNRKGQINWKEALQKWI